MPRHKAMDKDFVWTSKIAYIVGLLVTDGNLSKDGRHICFRSSDLQLINTFKDCLLITNSIAQSHDDTWATKPCHRIQFGNVQFYRWLLRNGLFPNKTYTIGDINIPGNYFPDFLRGHLDSDGDICTYIDRYNETKNPDYVYPRLYVRFRSASKIYMEWMQKMIMKIINVEGSLSKQKATKSYQTTSMWILRFAKKESIKLLSQLYYQPEVPCLYRKKDIFEQFMQRNSVLLK